MVQNETTAAESQREEPEKATERLGTLSAVEKVVQEYSVRVAKQYGVDPSHYQLHLVRKLDGIMAMRRGPVVQVYLLWPDAQPEINSILGRAFQIIATRPMRDVWAVEPYAHVLKRRAERKEWFKTKFGDEAEFLAELLPNTRITRHVTVQRTVTLTDKDTGISVSVTDDNSRTRWDMEQEARIKLSRLVYLYEQDQIEKQSKKECVAIVPLGFWNTIVQ